MRGRPFGRDSERWPCAADLRRLGITSPGELLRRDLYALYDDLCRATGQRHHLCLHDTFIAAVRYMVGEPQRPWWKYTAERKRELAARSKGDQEVIDGWFKWMETERFKITKVM